MSIQELEVERDTHYINNDIDKMNFVVHELVSRS